MTTWTKEIKPTINNFLLMQDGAFLLLQTGGKIVLSRNFGDWNINSKNPVTWTKTAK